MPKKLITPAAPQIIVPALNRRQILGGLGALALPILGCGGGEGDGSPDGVAGAQGFPGGSGVGGSGVGGNGFVGGSFSGGSGPGPAGAPSVEGGSGPATAGAPNGGSENIAGSGITGGTSPGGAPGAGGTSAGAGGTSAGAAGSAGSGGSGGDFLPIPDWAEVPSCTQSKTDGAGQGPFFIHEMEKNDDVSMLRQDLRGRHHQDAEPGIEFQFHLRFLTVGSCNTPIKDLEIYIWNTDAQGFYSGFGLDGTSTEQKPDNPYAGTPNSSHLQNAERYCRGYQLTDDDGVVSFKTIYPGFYNGRDVHTHLVVLKKGSIARATRGSYTACPGGGGFGSAPSCDRGDGDHIFTTQIYYDEAFTRELHTSFEPYKRRTSNSAWAGAIRGDEGGSSGIKVVPTLETGDIVRGQVQLIIDPTRSVGGGGG